MKKKHKLKLIRQFAYLISVFIVTTIVFTAIVTAIGDTNDNGSVASRSISLTATGEVTHYPSLS